MRCQRVDVEQIVVDYFFFSVIAMACIACPVFYFTLHSSLWHCTALYRLQHAKQATSTCNAIILCGFCLCFLLWVVLLSFHLLVQWSRGCCCCRFVCIYLGCIVCVWVKTGGKKNTRMTTTNEVWCTTLWIFLGSRQCGNYCCYSYLYSMQLPSFRVKHCIQLLMNAQYLNTRTHTTAHRTMSHNSKVKTWRLWEIRKWKFLRNSMIFPKTYSASGRIRPSDNIRPSGRIFTLMQNI